jgi:Fe-S-cluster containining protein
MFLGTAGCVLPLETRPLLCRIYPFDFNQQGIKPELANGCPVELLRKGETLLQALDMNKLDAERWHGMLYEEILEEPHYRAKQSGKLGPG